MNRFVVFILLLFSSLLFSKTLVTVNGYKVDDSIIPAGYENLDDTKRAQLMEQLIKEELIHQYVLKQKDIVNSKEFKEAFTKQKELAQKQYKKSTGKRLTKAQIRNIKGSLALMFYQKREFEKAKVSTKEAREFYNNNQDKFNYPDSIEIANIIVKTKKEAQDIIHKLKKSKDLDKDFIKMAHEHKQNGYMGWFGKGMAPENLFNSAFKAKPKTLLSKPIKTKYGYHVVYLLNKKKAGKLSFKDAKRSIINMLKQKKILDKLRDKIDNLYSNAEIVY